MGNLLTSFGLQNGTSNTCRVYANMLDNLSKICKSKMYFSKAHLVITYQFFTFEQDEMKMTPDQMPFQ